MDAQETKGKCRYLDDTPSSDIKHEICKNPKMKELNHSKDDEPLPCIGKRCNCAEYNEA